MPLLPLPKPPEPKPYSPLANDITQKRQQFYKSKQDDVDRQFRGAQQENDDVITRRMTALGQGGSGAAIGLQMKGRADIQGQQAAATNALAGQQAAEEAQYLQAHEMADKDQTFKRSLFDIEQGNKLKEMDLAERQFEMDKDTTEFNKRMAELAMGQEDGGLFGINGKTIGKRALGSVVGGAVMGPVGSAFGAVKKIF